MFLDNYRFHGLLDAHKTMLFLLHNFDVVHVMTHPQAP